MKSAQKKCPVCLTHISTGRTDCLYKCDLALRSPTRRRQEQERTIREREKQANTAGAFLQRI